MSRVYGPRHEEYDSRYFCPTRMVSNQRTRVEFSFEVIVERQPDGTWRAHVHVGVFAGAAVVRDNPAAAWWDLTHEVERRAAQMLDPKVAR